MNENDIQPVANEVITFDPPINVNPNVIAGGMVVSTA
jgi:hypothetical protein